MFPQTPLLGQGFGGWQLGFTQYAASVGIPANFPPHNLLIYTWSQGGICALACALGFIAAIMRFASRHLPSRDPELFGLSFALNLRAALDAGAIDGRELQHGRRRAHGADSGFALRLCRYAFRGRGSPVRGGWNGSRPRRPERSMPSPSDVSPVAAIFRLQMFKPSEPFIAAQAGAPDPF